MFKQKKERLSCKKISFWAIVASLSGAGLSSVSIQYKYKESLCSHNCKVKTS